MTQGTKQLALTVEAWAPLVLAAHLRGEAGAGASGRKSTGAAQQLPIHSFSLIKVLEEVRGLKNLESAISLSLLRNVALGILLFMPNMEGVCASSN